jgi:2-polyprenyl-6-methoxyphenol hydroxylase-like FAD-dependent oxidoreductase
MLDAYRQSRRRDASRGVAFTDFLASIFADGRRLPTWGRGLALHRARSLPARAARPSPSG